MITWAGWLLVLYGGAHTLGALTVEGAASHADSWFTGELWGEDLSDMSAAGSAYWLSVNSFGPPLVVVGLLVLWLRRQDARPPAFVGWAVGAWTAVDAVVSGLTPWPIAALAAVLLVLGSRRTQQELTAPHGGPG